MADSKYFGIPFGTSGDKATIPEATQPSGAISYTQGFGPDYERDPATDPLAKRVPRDETNELYFQVTNALKFLQLYGTPEWYATDDAGNPVSYPLTARVRHDAGSGMQVWRSLVATNTATPGSDPTKWTLDDPFNLSNLEATLTEALAGTIGTKIMTPRRTASSVQRGAWNYATAGGTAAVITVTLTPALAAYSAGLHVALKLTASITGATTLNVNGLGAVPVIRSDGTALKSGDGLTGEILDLIYDGSNFQLIGKNSSALPPQNVLVLTSPGTTSWVVPAGITRAVVEVIGGGGGSGGASPGNTGAGGAGGGYAQKLVNGLTPGASISVTVGAGGAAGAINGGNGGQGGTSSFGAFVSATGGAGGGGNTTNGSNGGGGVSGDININGQAGNGGSTITTNALMGGGGGGAPNGAAGRQFGITSTNGAFNGFPGVAPGGGGSGGASTAGSTAPVTGAAGGAGQVVIRW